VLELNRPIFGLEADWSTGDQTNGETFFEATANAHQVKVSVLDFILFELYSFEGFWMFTLLGLSVYPEES